MFTISRDLGSQITYQCLRPFYLDCFSFFLLSFSSVFWFFWEKILFGSPLKNKPFY